VPARAAIKRFFRTPKGLLILVLALLIVLAGISEGAALLAPGLAAAIVAASAIDVLLVRMRQRAWQFPSGAILTGMFVAMILSPQQPPSIAAWTSVVAIASKHAVRTRSANVFNPAALALVVTFYLFHTTQNWWGAMPDLTSFALVVLFATGIFITDRVNKMPLVLVFLGSYYALFTAMAFLGRAQQVAEIFRAPDLQAALFFAFFILTDPPTSPVKYRDQIACGAIVAASSFAVFEWIGAVHYLLSGVLVGNVWEAWRRTHAPAGRAAVDSRNRAP
jgi:Na+-translocating ferredoxin:NAD+ oxidoreductase RnfD subunit